MQKRIPPSSPPPVPGVEDAAVEYVDKVEAYRRYIQEGLDAVARGDVYDWEDVKAELRAKYGNPED